MRNGRIYAVLLIMAVLSGMGCKKGPSEQDLFNSAKTLQEQSDFKGAIAAYLDIVKKFPKSAQAPQCQFMVGYLYANHLKNIDLAKDAYRKFIKDYPEHQLVKDAQWELDHLGQDVNEIDELNKMLTKEGGAGPAKKDTLKLSK
jgi:TolA-binding protein